MPIEELDIFVGDKNRRSYLLIRAEGPFVSGNASEDPLGTRLHAGLYHLALHWGFNALEISDRFSFPQVAQAKGLSQAQDCAYLAVDIDTGNVVADVLLLRDRLYPSLGIYCYVYTKEEHRRNHLCERLVEISSNDFFDSGGKLLILHTEFPVAYELYERFGFVRWYGKKPKDVNGKDKGAVMLMENPREKRSIAELVEEHFAVADKKLEVRPLLRSDYAQFLMLCSAYPNRDVVIPALQVDGGWNAEGRFIKQSLLGQPSDRLYALITSDHRLVGVGAITHRNKALKRKVRTKSIFVHNNFAVVGYPMLNKWLSKG